MKKEKNNLNQPISMVGINRLLVAVIIALTFLAGYFHAQVGTLEKKIQLLEEQLIAP